MVHDRDDRLVTKNMKVAGESRDQGRVLGQDAGFALQVTLKPFCRPAVLICYGEQAWKKGLVSCFRCCA